MWCDIWRSISAYRVALACAVINLLHIGMLRIIGLQVVASIHRYSVNREQASFPYIFRQIVNQISGPFIGYLGCKLGIERVTVLGCILSSVAIGACFFAESILTVTICWGVCFGMSAAMADQLLPTFLPAHFKENLSRANGLSVAGSALGASLYSPFYEYLLETYGISGAFLILSAVCLNTLPAAMFLVYSQRRLSDKRKHSKNENFVNRQVICSETPTGITNDTCQTVDLGEDHLKMDKNDMVTTYEIKTEQSVDELRIIHKGMYNPIGSNNHVLADNAKRFCENINNPEKNNSFMDLSDACMKYSGNLQGISNEKDISINKIPQDSRRNSLEDNMANCASNYSNTPDKPSTKSFDTSNPRDGSKRKSFWEVFTLFYDPLFLVLAFTQSSFLVIVQLLAATLIDFALDKGVPTHLSAYVLMLSSVTDLFGRLLLGNVTDCGCMSASNFSALCYFCVGAMFYGIALSWEFFGVLVSVCCGGFLIGGQMLISPVLVSKYFGGERRTMAMASRYILAVPLCFTVSPLIGFFRDGLGSYDWLYYSIGAFSAISSILLLFLPSIAKSGRYRRDDQVDD